MTSNLTLSLSLIFFLRCTRDGGQHRFRLVHAFVKFARGIGIGHDTRPRLQIGSSVFQNDRAYRDAAVVRSIKAEVTNTSRVKSASRFFQFGNALHRATFLRAHPPPPPNPCPTRATP